MRVLIIGANGNMASRYKAIFNHLGVSFDGIDIDTPDDGVQSALCLSDRFLIATPTDTHFHWITKCMPFKKPILCEKPVTKDLNELGYVLEQCRIDGVPFRAVYQYSMLARSEGSGDTCYNYFKHGNDGLYWDCMQITALSRCTPALYETAPIWDCVINGERLNLSDMDRAYVEYIKLWLEKPNQDPIEVWNMHYKTHQLMKQNEL